MSMLLQAGHFASLLHEPLALSLQLQACHHERITSSLSQANLLLASTVRHFKPVASQPSSGINCASLQACRKPTFSQHQVPVEVYFTPPLGAKPEHSPAPSIYPSAHRGPLAR